MTIRSQLDARRRTTTHRSNSEFNPLTKQRIFNHHA
jgi:hypothetical protein